MLPPEYQINQEISFEKAIKFARENPKKIYVAPWFKPKTQKISDKMISLIKENLDITKAVKFHPYHSALDFDEKEMIPYIELAQEFNLPVLTHTGTGQNDHPQKVFNMAKKFPKVNFVMVHLGLGSDNSEAIELASKVDNLYGDTTWVSMESAIKFIKKVGSTKIFFGSDTPIDGTDTYHHNGQGDRSLYQDYFFELEKLISPEEYDNLMWKNALTFFGLE